MSECLWHTWEAHRVLRNFAPKMNHTQILTNTWLLWFRWWDLELLNRWDFGLWVDTVNGLRLLGLFGMEWMYFFFFNVGWTWILGAQAGRLCKAEYVIKLRIVTGGDYPKLPMCAWCNHNCPHERQECQSRSKRFEFKWHLETERGKEMYSSLDCPEGIQPW